MVKIVILLVVVAILLVSSVVYLSSIHYQSVFNEMNVVLPTASATPCSSSLSPQSSTGVPTSTPSTPTLPAQSQLCNCSWTISSGTNVEFLVTSPSGKQTGYLQASNSYVSGIPDASYGIEEGIADDTGQNPSLPNILVFMTNSAENGTYTMQIIPKQLGKYHLEVAFVWGPGSSKVVPIEGTLVTNQTDKYTITFPSGTVQKVCD
jgi:hypothetical protein